MSEPEYTAPDFTLLGAEHIAAYRESDGEVGYLWNGVPTLLLTGTSGAGKTTLLSVLLRFADVDEGRITVDGVDLRDLPVDEWRRRIA